MGVASTIHLNSLFANKTDTLSFFDWLHTICYANATLYYTQTVLSSTFFIDKFEDTFNSNWFIPDAHDSLKPTTKAHWVNSPNQYTRVVQPVDEEPVSGASSQNGDASPRVKAKVKWNFLGSLIS